MLLFHIFPVVECGVALLMAVVQEPPSGCGQSGGTPEELEYDVPVLGPKAMPA